MGKQVGWAFPSVANSGEMMVCILRDHLDLIYASESPDAARPALTTGPHSE